MAIKAGQKSLVRVVSGGGVEWERVASMDDHREVPAFESTWDGRTQWFTPVLCVAVVGIQTGLLGDGAEIVHGEATDFGGGVIGKARSGGGVEWEHVASMDHQRMVSSSCSTQWDGRTQWFTLALCVAVISIPARVCLGIEPRLSMGDAAPGFGGGVVGSRGV